MPRLLGVERALDRRDRVGRGHADALVEDHPAADLAALGPVARRAAAAAGPVVPRAVLALTIVTLTILALALVTRTILARGVLAGGAGRLRRGLGGLILVHRHLPYPFADGGRRGTCRPLVAPADPVWCLKSSPGGPVHRPGCPWAEGRIAGVPRSSGVTLRPSPNR
ncbi:hypothetical protein mvi_04800 [Methylobacterium indicum]|uniref:Uncharacterized protein n=1 Tax=Methylobacterium indicum TaxID=1775910 RepID=A0A8H8WPL4_9HYPH|nr:hypothetical protein mvi_04800 [Methylobacterium indicum]